MTSKFNKDMNAKMRAKKSEPLSNIGKKTVRVVGKGLSATPPSSVTPILSGTETTRTASPSTSVEELPTPVAKRPRLTGKEKEKEVEDAGRSSVWSDEKLAVDRAHTIVTADDLKVFSGVPFNTVAGGHVHKLVQALGESLHIASEYLTQEAKLASLVSKVQALENENSQLKKNLIDSMDEATTLKEKVKVLGDDLRVERQLNLEKDEQLQNSKEMMKTIAARSVEAFQTTEEYNTVLFSWYFKGFELLRRYLVKHPTGVDMGNLDLEEVDKEMASDEAAASVTPADDVPGDAPADDDTVADAPDA
ncbi:uncharacterized protein LOC136067136 [Quercus suber]|uniref:uncharacterized protein LOC136067136 n=1 Tax=Quercus suber TaxID=58331 RepID=UPI0032DF8A49